MIISMMVFLLALPMAAQDPLKLDIAKLENTEERTEALANRLLALSVATRDKDIDRMATFFEKRIAVPVFPAAPAEAAHRFKWIYGHDWKFQGGDRLIPSKEFLAQWRAFLEHFSAIEDVRFKVKLSEIKGDTARARIFFFLVGRDMQSRREWVKGYARVEARLANDEWRLYFFRFENLTSVIAGVDIFSEVSVPAGVAVTFPPYGSQRNDEPFWKGAAAADVNLDGLIDVFAAGIWENYLYLNQGDGGFLDVSARAWLKILPRATAPLFLDFDNDGDSDLFLSSPDAQMLFENRIIPDGKLEFQDVSLFSGVGLKPAIGFSPIAGDIDGDGLTDIYLPSYNRYGLVMPNSWHRASNGTPNLLFLNLGGGRFKEAAHSWGIADRRWSYAAQFADLDEDGDLDLYVANDYGENGLFINQGDRYTDEARARGGLDPGNGMGVSLADYDNDGDLDLHVTNMSSTAGNRILKRLLPEVSPEKNVLAKLASGNSLYENLGNGFFKDVTAAAGGFSSGWAWGGGFVDFDNDGWEDLYTPNGFISGKSMKDT